MPNTRHAPEYLTYPEAANEFNTSQFVLRRLASAGRLTRYRSVRDGRRVLLSRSELDREFSVEAMNVPQPSV